MSIWQGRRGVWRGASRLPGLCITFRPAVGPGSRLELGDELGMEPASSAPPDLADRLGWDETLPLRLVHPLLVRPVHPLPVRPLDVFPVW